MRLVHRHSLNANFAVRFEPAGLMNSYMAESLADGRFTHAMFVEQPATHQLRVIVCTLPFDHASIGFHRFMLYELCDMAVNHGLWHINVSLPFYLASHFDNLGLYRTPDPRELMTQQLHGMTGAIQRQLQTLRRAPGVQSVADVHVAGDTAAMRGRLAVDHALWDVDAQPDVSPPLAMPGIGLFD